MYDLVIIGAGPCGLACGIEAQQAGLSFIILDKGSITESVRRYPLNMKFFSTSENISIGGIPFPSTEMRPSRTEALKYYRLVAEHYNLPLQLFTEVIHVEGENGSFTVQTTKGEIQTKKVVLSIGYYDVPKKIKIPGEELPHVSHYYDEPFRYAHQKVVVVGGANSAVETALDLYRNGVDVSVVHQFPSLDKTAKYWIVPDLQNRIKKGEVPALFEHKVVRIEENQIIVEDMNTGEEKEVLADFVFLMTGYRPDGDFLRKLGIELTGEALIPTMDPNTYESNVPGIFVCGSVVGGEETARVFIENGKLHGKKIIHHIQSQ
ncbi:MAG TPA: YpdA family putative bacillithiol disulfide reductase [Cytophagales bacterium]|nr:YpdA family putative bacillithiol disulfide reductase [Cytophagales bacterium]HAA18011.1 YpdA family putative bacillithiol disulfide reductase [Cytophagales bacterium]HAP63081.1 YpdA family putative bacillithiol disulfide reductase [Cytophagales bacterium]